MRQTFKMIALIIVLLGLLDFAVAQVLNAAKNANRLTGLVTYFEYGRSVPGKINNWKADPNGQGVQITKAWPVDVIAKSTASFPDEILSDNPVIRTYGMSFVDNILTEAVDINPQLNWERHSGPGGPPNLTYSLFQDDRANRREGDVVVLGLLSAVLPSMQALSNRTWVFEQPWPFTYPIYELAGGELLRVDPVVASLADEMRIDTDQGFSDKWYAQLREKDIYIDARTYGAPWLDISPFARLVRRSVAKAHLDRVKAEFVEA